MPLPLRSVRLVSVYTDIHTRTYTHSARFAAGRGERISSVPGHGVEVGAGGGFDEEDAGGRSVGGTGSKWSSRVRAAERSS